MADARIFIVEDEGIVAMELEDRLRGLGYEVVGQAASGEEAVARLGHDGCDLVLMDIVLKGTMDGIQTTEYIRSVFDLPVIYVTAHTDERTLERAKVTQPFGYILKPFSERELAATIEMALYKHRMEKMVRESEQWLATTLLSIGDGVVTADVDGRVTFMNPVAESVTGWTHSDALGRPATQVFNIIGEAQGVQVRPHTGGTVRECTLITRGGDELPIEYVASPIPDRGGRVSGVVIAFHDISERKTAERELREAKEYAEKIVQKAKVMIVGLDLDGRIRVFNEAAERVTGYSYKEAAGKNWFDLIVPRDRYPHVWEEFDRWRNGALLVAEAFEHPVLTKSGEERMISWRNTEVRDGDRAVGMIALGIDTTEHRRFEEKLRHTKKMEAVGTLAGGVAHDFNNILTAILCYGELLKDRVGQDETAASYVERILGSSNRAAELVRGLLAFGAAQPSVFLRVDLRGLVRDLSGAFRRMVGNGMRIEVSVPDEPLFVLGNRTQIEQCLSNLVANARDAMPDGGSLSIVLETKEMSAAFVRREGYGVPGRYARLSVKDSGSGMDAQTRERIFDPFYTTKDVGKGTGLGLSVTYGIVEQHGGYITVDSEPGKGTTFVLYLPIARRRARGGVKRTAGPATPHGSDETKGTG